MTRILRALLLSSALLAPAAALAEPTHAIAMHGAPKYPADFAHLDHVNPDAPKGGMMRYAAVGTFDNLNPYTFKGVTAQGVGGTIDPMMVRVQDEPFSLYCLVCETVDMAEDRGSIAFELRPEARFHDGSPITVDDVIFTFEKMRAEGTPSRRRAYGKVASVERVGERGVKFTFKPNDDGVLDREMPLILGLTLAPLQKSYWEGRNLEETTLEPFPGSGAYRIVKFEPGRFIEYERVKDHWAKDLPIMRGVNNFDVVRYEYFRNDAAALEAFKAHEYDFRREGDVEKWATAYDFPAVKDGRVKMELLPQGFPAPMRGYFYNTRRAPFDDRRVREALGLTFDFEWMNKTLFRGAYARNDSYFSNSVFAARDLPSDAELKLLEPFRKDLPEEVFTTVYQPPATDGSGPAGLRANMRKALDLLREAGYELKDGVMVGPDGKPLAFEILLNGSADERVTLEWTRALERLGVKADIRVVDSAQYQRRRDTLDFDVVLERFVTSLSPGIEQVRYWGSKEADVEGTRNHAGIKNPATDFLADYIGTTRTYDDLTTGMRALDRTLIWGHYVVPHFYVKDAMIAHWDNVERPQTTPLYGTVVEHWWAKP